jgi:hypothetical protein
MSSRASVATCVERTITASVSRLKPSSACGPGSITMGGTTTWALASYSCVAMSAYRSAPAVITAATARISHFRFRMTSRYRSRSKNDSRLGSFNTTISRSIGLAGWFTLPPLFPSMRRPTRPVVLPQEGSWARTGRSVRRLRAWSH